MSTGEDQVNETLALPQKWKHQRPQVYQNKVGHHADLDAMKQGRR